MRHALTLLFSTAAMGAVGCATPALAQVSNGGDSNAQTEQAQLHPMQANEAPLYVPGGAPEGEVYPSAGPYAYYGPNGMRADSLIVMLTARRTLLPRPIQQRVLWQLPACSPQRRSTWPPALSAD
jgi:hypothetical protein